MSKEEYILATEPARFTRFYDKLKKGYGGTFPCTHFIQLEMPDELTAMLLQRQLFKNCSQPTEIARSETGEHLNGSVSYRYGLRGEREDRIGRPPDKDVFLSALRDQGNRAWKHHLAA